MRFSAIHAGYSEEGPGRGKPYKPEKETPILSGTAPCTDAVFVKRFQKVKKAYKNAAKKGNFILADRTSKGRANGGVPSRKAAAPRGSRPGLLEKGRAPLERRGETFIRSDSRFRRGGIDALLNGERSMQSGPPSTRP